MYSDEKKCKLSITFLQNDSIHLIYLQDALLGNQTLVSPVLGSSVANLSISNLTENIQFTIRNINPVQVSVKIIIFFMNLLILERITHHQHFDDQTNGIVYYL